MFSIDELEIMISALERDIQEQKKLLDEMEEEGGSDLRFSMWLVESEQLLKKLSLKLEKAKSIVWREEE